MNFEALSADLDKRNYAPVYLLHGEESYFIDVLARRFEEEVLSEDQRAFNLTLLYGKDSQPGDVLDAARRYPVFAEKQVVIVKEFQDMKVSELLENYLQHPVPDTVLVFCHKHKKINMTTKLGKAFKAHAIVFESVNLYDNQIPAWATSYARKQGLSLSNESAVLLAEYLGTDLSKLTNEIDKLALNLGKGAAVTPAHIEQHIGISKEYNVFELQRALGQNDVLKVQRIATYFAANARKNPPVVVIASLYSFYSKLLIFHTVKSGSEPDVLKALGLKSAFFLKDYREAAKHIPYKYCEKAIALLREFDLKSKGLGFIQTGKDDGVLVRELCWKLLHIGQVSIPALYEGVYE